MKAGKLLIQCQYRCKGRSIKPDPDTIGLGLIQPAVLNPPIQLFKMGGSFIKDAFVVAAILAKNEYYYLPVPP